MFKLRHFDWLAPIYEKVISGEVTDKLIKVLDLQPEQWILDAGGGTGRIAAGLLGERRRIVVGDASLKMLLQANQKEGLLCAVCDAKQLPFGNQFFDRIVIVDAFHHISDQNQALSDLWRVLKPGGTLTIEEPDISHASVKLIALLEAIFLMGSKFLRAEELVRMIKLHQPQKVMVYNENHSYWVTAIK
ncbi:MAG: class I SAM-dependent methyltransferase [Bellilinea sp.]